MTCGSEGSGPVGSGPGERWLLGAEDPRNAAGDPKKAPLESLLILLQWAPLAHTPPLSSESKKGLAFLAGNSSAEETQYPHVLDLQLTVSPCPL